MSILERDPSEPPEQRKRACECGYPDMPGFCPGPERCPMAQHEENEDEE